MANRFRRRSSRALALAAVALSLLAPTAGAADTGPLAYIPVAGEGAVVVVDTAADRIVGRVEGVGPQASAVTASRDGRHLYVQAFNPPFVGVDDIAVIDSATDSVTARIPITGTDGMARPITDPVRDLVYVITARPSIDVLSTTSNTLVRSMPLPSLALAAAISPDGGRLYAVFADSTAAVFDPESGFQLGERIQIDGSVPAFAAVSPDGHKLYAMNALGDNVSVIDTASWRRLGAIALPPGSAPVSGAFSPDGDRLLVATPGANAVQVVDVAADRVTSAVPVDAPVSIGFTADGAKLYVGSLGPQAGPVIAPVAGFDATSLLQPLVVASSRPSSVISLDAATLRPSGSPVAIGAAPGAGAFTN
ncbi:YncE family protein [Nocardia sp. NPDC050793]|uniref:YncE family protein n=1 Tax=Nocardia sp. NPDC050793 TaxID=3155159 RepID=UPI0033C42271